MRLEQWSLVLLGILQSGVQLQLEVCVSVSPEAAGREGECVLRSSCLSLCGAWDTAEWRAAAAGGACVDRPGVEL